MDERTLKRLGMELIQVQKKIKNQEKDWEEDIQKSLDLLGVKYNEQTRPFKGASNYRTHPLSKVKVLQLSKQHTKELLPGDGL